MPVNTRRLCLDILVEVLEEGTFCNTALHECLNKNPALDKKERAFLSALAEGVVERSIELDYVINMYSDKSVTKLKPLIRNILRMAVYQILYMDQVPDSAAVNEAVKLAVKKGYGGLRGFVNGVLRNIVRNKDKLEYPDSDRNTMEYISVKYSMPQWLVRYFLEEMSADDVIKTMEYYMNTADTVLRLTAAAGRHDIYTEKLDHAGLNYTSGRIFDYAYRLQHAGRIDELPGYSEGHFVVQDESSMIPGHIAVSWINNKLQSSSGITRVLDMCAAPGGKTLHIAGSFGNNVCIDSCDISEYKVNRISDNAKRLNLSNVNAMVRDAMELDEKASGRYDVVIADLPCSGLGVLARKADIKYNVSESSVNELVHIQRTMLDNAASYVAPGGILVYSTCTINRHENEENAQYFADNNQNYKLCSPGQFFEGETLDRISAAFTEKGYIRVIPGIMQSDGFFVAVFQREG